MQEFIVSNLEDENDGDFSTEDLSLREAIAIAESGDAIAFSSDLSETTINLSLGELVIDKNLAIDGLGSDRLTIDAGGESRVFNIDDGNEETFLNVAIDGLAITSGNAANTDTEFGGRGGGIFTQENLELSNSVISNNSAISAGAGIYSSGEQLNISNSTVTDNSATFIRGVGQGGGIATVGTTVEISDSQITNNGSANGAGGIDVSDSDITIVGSDVSSNSGLRAGGIASQKSTVNVSASSINNNSTGVFNGSGAIDSDSDSVLNIDRSTVDANSGIDPFNPSPPRGSEAFASGIGARGTTTITNSTVSNSIVERIDDPVPADDPRGEIPESVIGFGIRNTGELNVVNSTFAGNENGGISNEGGLINISNTTIADALANVDLAADDNATVNSSIVVDDSQVEAAIDNNQNLIGNSDSLNLSELQNNGGVTQTIALSADSQAIDAGSNSNNLATDQRGEGFDRTVGGRTDIGAFELQNEANPTTPGNPDALVVSTLEDENDGDFSDEDLSLREAIAIANEREGTDKISFADSLSGGTIGLTENQTDPRGLGTINVDLLITDSVEIDGLGADNLTLDGLNDGGGIFRIDGDNTNVTVEGLNITNGSRQPFFRTDFLVGGAVFAQNDSSSFTLRNSAISNSRAQAAGAIFSNGSVTIENSLITGNESGSGLSSSGNASPRGAVVVNGDLNVINSTIAQNTGVGITNGGTADISNSTITDGIGLFDSDSTTITSSIVVRNNDEENANAPSITSNSGQSITSGGNNLIGNGDDIDGFVDSDLVGTGENILDPLLGELQNNGGATSTIALQEGSLAIDAGSNPQNLVTDQRGEGFDRTVGARTDIGAFELQDNDLPKVPAVEVPNIQPPDIEVPNVQPPNIQPPEIEVPNIQPPNFGNLEGTENNDHLSGEGTNEDVISGGAGHDTLDGNGGNDHILGGSGDDLIFGGAGDDLLDGNEGHNEISGEDGKDTLYGGENNDSLIGGADDDLLVGGSGHDSLLGSSGHDIINGDEGDDFINGDRGDDLLTGGVGADTLLGGAGHDVFVLQAGDAHDTIVDFEPGSDRLQLSDSLSLSQLTVVDNESNTGSLILDSNNNDAIIAIVENVAAVDLDVHVFS